MFLWLIWIVKLHIVSSLQILDVAFMVLMQTKERENEKSTNEFLEFFSFFFSFFLSFSGRKLYKFDSATFHFLLFIRYLSLFAIYLFETSNIARLKLSSGLIHFNFFNSIFLFFFFSLRCCVSLFFPPPTHAIFFFLHSLFFQQKKKKRNFNLACFFFIPKTRYIYPEQRYINF